MDVDDYKEMYEKAMKEPLDNNKAMSIIRDSYNKMSEGNNVDGSLNLLTTLGHLAVLQRELAGLSHTDNYFNPEIIFNVIADVSIGFMYVQDACGIDANELSYSISHASDSDITSVQMLVMCLAELQQCLLIYLSGNNEKTYLTNALARSIIAIEIAQKMFGIPDEELSKMVKVKLEYIRIENEGL